MRAGPDRRTEKAQGGGRQSKGRTRVMKGGGGVREGERRDGKRSACRVLFSGVGKAGERQARTAARDEYERWDWIKEERREGWSSSIPDASMPEVSMLPYYVIVTTR